jgi:hypothetical protein
MYDRVFFKGDWGAQDQAAVAEAISVAEGARSAFPSRCFGKTWICIREVVDRGEAFYFASRFGLHRVLSARTPAELADQISALEQRVSSQVEL